MSAAPQKPALATAGVTVGGAGGSIVVGLLVAKLTASDFSFAKDWESVAALTLALAIFYGWAWLTARKPGVETGLPLFDGRKDGPGAG